MILALFVILVLYLTYIINDINILYNDIILGMQGTAVIFHTLAPLSLMTI